jgi:hypothetical protein
MGLPEGAGLALVLVLAAGTDLAGADFFAAGLGAGFLAGVLGAGFFAAGLALAAGFFARGFLGLGLAMEERVWER